MGHYIHSKVLALNLHTLETLKDYKRIMLPPRGKDYVLTFSNNINLGL